MVSSQDSEVTYLMFRWFYPNIQHFLFIYLYFFVLFTETFGGGWQWMAAGHAGSHSKQRRDRVKGLWQGKISILLPHNVLVRLFFCTRSDVLFYYFADSVLLPDGSSAIGVLCRVVWCGRYVKQKSKTFLEPSGCLTPVSISWSG